VREAQFVMPTETPQEALRTAHNGRSRLFLALLILLALGRLVWDLGGKNLWLDEALSLERAESPWSALILGTWITSDGLEQSVSIAQHPFGYFALLGVAVRLIGSSEFALRFLSVMVATLLVPAVWALARRLTRSAALPRSAALWAALLAAVNPFYLWYGQEARMYGLVALLAVISTYLLLRWTECRARRATITYLAGYALTTLLLVSSHFLAILILPVQAAVAFQERRRVNRRQALGVAVVVLVLAAIVALVGFQLSRTTETAHFVAVTIGVLIPDLVNAFSLGLSVDLAKVWGVDLLFALAALLGAVFGLRQVRRPANRGWILPALVAVPVLSLAVANLVEPAYINARHISLISGFYLILVGGGLAWLWQTRRWLGGAAAAVLLAATLYSTVNYFALPQYGKGQAAEMGAYLRNEIQPGDLLLWQPPEWRRYWRYYLPMDLLVEAGKRGADTAALGLPMVGKSTSEMIQELTTLAGQHRRIWIARGVGDPATNRWLDEDAFYVKEVGFESPLSLLQLKLYLPRAPIGDRPPDTIEHPADVAFGDRIRLLGYDLGQPLAPGLSIPVTLYWQAPAPLARRYKYILRLEADCGAAGQRQLAISEREPYDGGLPTTAWAPGAVYTEYAGVASPAAGAQASSYCLTLQMYDAETLEKLPVTRSEGMSRGADGFTVSMSYTP
jgi:mannosyltransferase